MCIVVAICNFLRILIFLCGLPIVPGATLHLMILVNNWRNLLDMFKIGRDSWIQFAQKPYRHSADCWLLPSIVHLFFFKNKIFLCSFGDILVVVGHDKQPQGIQNGYGSSCLLIFRVPDDMYYASLSRSIQVVWYFFFFGILLHLFAWRPFMNTYDNGSDAPTYFGIISTISMLQNCNTNFIYMPLLH